MIHYDYQHDGWVDSMNTGGAKILPSAVSLNIYPEFSFKSHSFFNEHIYKSVNCPLFIEFIYIHYFDELLFLLWCFMITVSEILLQWKTIKEGNKCALSCLLWLYPQEEQGCFFHLGIWSWRWTYDLLWWKLFWLSVAFIEDFIETCRSSWCAFCVNYIVSLADILNRWQSWNIGVRFHLRYFLIFCFW